jgi:hypothetical protein
MGHKRRPYSLLRQNKQTNVSKVKSKVDIVHINHFAIALGRIKKYISSIADEVASQKVPRTNLNIRVRLERFFK